jgi:hypothetical protein
MSVDIITGDARLALPTIAHADVVITDPVWPNCPEGLLQGWDRPTELLAETLCLLPAGVKRLVIVLRSDSDPRFLSAVPRQWPFFNAHWMQYAIPGYIGRKLGGNEIAYAFGEPVPYAKGRGLIPSVSPKAQPSDRRANGHPCSRAISHMEWLVNWWSEPGETVLDPFAGSGTVGLAANRLGRHAILIEIDPDHAANARMRVDRKVIVDGAPAGDLLRLMEPDEEPRADDQDAAA